MSQYKIKGIDYEDEKLEHAAYRREASNPYGAIKIGSPEYWQKYNAGAFQGANGVWYGKGSRELNRRDGKNRQNNTRNGEQQRANAPTTRNATPRASGRTQRGNGRGASGRVISVTRVQTPASAVDKGKDAIAKFMGGAVDPRGQAQPLEGSPKRKIQDAQGQPIIEKDARQQNVTQNENLLDRAGRAVTDAANAAGQWVGNAANDVGRAVTDAANAAGQWVGNAANDVGNFVGNTAQNVGRAVTDAANSAGQWVGNAANDVGRAVSNVVNPPRQEATKQQSLWDRIGGWFSQAAKDVGDTVVGAWNTASDAVGSAAKWVGDRLGEAGEWASTAAKDVGDWVGDRAQEFDTWLNGRQVVVTDRNGPNLTSHYERQGGALNDAGRALNAAGQWIGNAANDVGRWVGNAANDVGRTARNVADDVLGRYQVVDTDENGNLVYGNQRVGGLIDQGVRAAGRGINDLGQQVQTGWNDFTRGAQDTWNRGVQGARNVADDVLGRYQVVDTDENGNLVYGNQRVGGFLNDAGRLVSNAAGDAGRWVGDTANNVGQWVGNAANDVGRTARNVADDVLGRYQVVDTDENGNLVYGNQRVGGLIDQGARAAGRGINDLSREAQEMWNNNIVTPVAGVWNDFSTGARNAVDDVLGRYPVVDTDENGNLVYGNQRQGGALNRLVREATGGRSNSEQRTQDVPAGLVDRAINAGVPEGNVQFLQNQLTSGEITPAQFASLMNQNIEAANNRR